MFTAVSLVAVAGAVAITYILRELRKQKKGTRLPYNETAIALEDLHRRLRRDRGEVTN